MRIINSHTHLVEAGKLNLEASAIFKSSVFQEYEKAFPLLDPAIMIEQMDEAGIEKSVLFAVDAPYIYSSNEYVYSICQRYRSRFFGFASVNPSDPKAQEKLGKYVSQYEFTGLKFHPPLQKFSPNSKSVYPLYETACKLKIPVVFHVGSTPFADACLLEHANPLLIDQVAVDFPDLKIILTHLGTLWHNEAFMVVEKNPHVYIDTAAYLYEIPEILNKNLINRLGSHKIIFGTDYPMPFAGMQHKMVDFVRCIQNLELDEKDKANIFCHNFESILEL